MTPFERLSGIMLPKIEEDLRKAVDRAATPETAELHRMLAYHLGWEGEGAGPEARGKRIRPLLVTLTAAASGAPWLPAIPAAVAVELVHNFSLIHDDIEDNSLLRRGRPTLWAKWGVAHAINAGDALYTLAYLAISDLRSSLSAEAVLEATVLLSETCLALTQGQYLDMNYQDQNELPVEAYWPMVGGKTAALLAAAAELGAIAGRVDPPLRAAYRAFGHALGLAFQAQDDLLGIWGEAALTGKSTESDLLEGKKSLPVLFGLNQGGAFATRWAKGPIQAGEVAGISRQLETEGARAFTLETVERLTGQALEALEDTHPRGEAGQALRELANHLLRRRR